MEDRQKLKESIERLNQIKYEYNNYKNEFDRIIIEYPYGEGEEVELDDFKIEQLKYKFIQEENIAQELCRRLKDTYNSKRDKAIERMSKDISYADKKIKKANKKDKINIIVLEVLFIAIIAIAIILGIVTFYIAFNYRELLEINHNIDKIYPLVKGIFESLFVTFILTITIFKYKYYKNK